MCDFVMALLWGFIVLDSVLPEGFRLLFRVV